MASPTENPTNNDTDESSTNNYLVLTASPHVPAHIPELTVSPAPESNSDPPSAEFPFLKHFDTLISFSPPLHDQPPLRYFPITADLVGTAPKQVGKLDPVGNVDEFGALCGIRFEAPSGESSNVFAMSTLSDGAVLYQGPYCSINYAVKVSSCHGITDTVCWMRRPLTNSQIREGSQASGFHRVDLHISHENTGVQDDRPIANLDNPQDEWMVIIFPRQACIERGLLEPGYDPDKQPRLAFYEVARGPRLNDVRLLDRSWVIGIDSY
ncbi:hypothetical protein FHETE_10611 [Fusarium heterosporum]|uniref:Uncharacterized protein n=1 Tax=Fusarium heterosporum TaxID=42747 RepID=A0A8H5SQI6_FUSHE|nr:hypothetical protein FHETE_10611 [Fusarium heterosporum]